MSDIREEERRQYPRAEIKWPVNLWIAQAHIKGETRNISAGGVYLESKLLPFKDEIFNMAIKPYHLQHLNITAKVAWVNMYASSDNKFKPHGTGALFVKISDEDRQFLSRVVSDHLKSELEKGATDE